ncbi:MAG TPA: hypothetical protein VGO24_04230 [Solirubrobacterales bacterium]|jgi:hypothetical protein|nr:hypothetical protein [Solirubrobacterales bacterium]
MGGIDDNWSTREGDIATESAVLQLVLDLHPVLLTLAEVVREVAGEEASFAERDSIERAVRDLSGAGLLHRKDEFAIPTRAALRFNELLDR